MNVKNTFDAKVPRSKMRAALELYARNAAQYMEKDAKENAPWTDRTGHARTSIQGTQGWEGDVLKIILSGNMEYFYYLEMCHEKKWAIIKPTIDKNALKIFNGYYEMLR